MIRGGCDGVPLGLAPPVLDGCNSMTGLGLDAQAKPSGSSAPEGARRSRAGDSRADGSTPEGVSSINPGPTD